MIIHPEVLTKLIERKLAFIEYKKIFIKCPDCGKFVRINKPIIGDLHFCTED